LFGLKKMGFPFHKILTQGYDRKIVFASQVSQN